MTTPGGGKPSLWRAYIMYGASIATSDCDCLIDSSRNAKFLGVIQQFLEPYSSCPRSHGLSEITVLNLMGISALLTIDSNPHPAPRRHLDRLYESF
jgi:hypothetical protein